MKAAASPLGRTRRGLRIVAIVASCIAIGGAQAAWQVTDQESQRILREISGRVGSGNANEKLGQIYEAHRLGTASDSGDLEPEPAGDERLDQNRISPELVDASDRCPSGDSGLRGKQKRICEELIKTEKAKFAYSVRMFKRMEKRKERLDELERERGGLGSHEYARLQSNSNELLALISLLQIDQQQHAAYMAAYDARIHYLAAARDTLSRQALEGSRKTTAAGVGGTVGGAVALHQALEHLRSERNANWRTGDRRQ